jgi:hypothetical protein
VLELPGFKGLRKIPWKNISPGMIVISGVSVNNTTPPELFNYPTLNAGLIYEIAKKYHFKDGKEVVIAEVEKGNSPEKLAISLRTIEKRLQIVNEFRKYILQKKILLSEKIEFKDIKQNRVIDSDYVVKSESILNLFNSFEVKLKGFKTPSIFNKLSEDILLIDIFNKNIIKKFDFPDDRQIFIHLVIDYSKEMFESKYLKETILAIESFKKLVLDCNINMTLNYYGFSDECNPLKTPISERDMERKGRNYSSFQKKILRFKKPNVINKVILISCGTPDDFMDAIETGGKLKRGGIDYSQIMLQKIPLKTTIEKWKAICMTCSGNQIILKEVDLLELALLEIFDLYLGNVTLANKTLIEPVFKEFANPKVISKVPNEEQKKRVIKTFEFKKL